MLVMLNAGNAGNAEKRREQGTAGSSDDVSDEAYGSASLSRFGEVGSLGSFGRRATSENAGGPSRREAHSRGAALSGRRSIGWQKAAPGNDPGSTNRPHVLERLEGRHQSARS